LVTWYLFHWVMYFIVRIASLCTNVYELNSARGEGLHILYPPWLFPFDVCNSVFSGYIEAPRMAGRLRFTRSFGPRSTLGSMVDNMKLFFAGLFSMDIRSSSWYALSGIFFSGLYWIVALGVQLQYVLCAVSSLSGINRSLGLPRQRSLWAVGFVEQVADQEVEETDIFCYRCLAGHVQLVTWYLFHWVMYFIVRIAWLRTNVYELNSACGEGLHILYPPWLFPFDVCVCQSVSNVLGDIWKISDKIWH